MNKNIKEKPETFEEAFKLAKKYPDHTIRFYIPQWRVTLIMEKDRKNGGDNKLDDNIEGEKKESVWAKLIRGAGEPELSDGKTVTSQNYKKHLYGKDGFIK